MHNVNPQLQPHSTTIMQSNGDSQGFKHTSNNYVQQNSMSMNIGISFVLLYTPHNNIRNWHSRTVWKSF